MQLRSFRGGGGGVGRRQQSQSKPIKAFVAVRGLFFVAQSVNKGGLPHFGLVRIVCFACAIKSKDEMNQTKPPTQLWIFLRPFSHVVNYCP